MKPLLWILPREVVPSLGSATWESTMESRRSSPSSCSILYILGTWARTGELEVDLT